MLSAIAASTGRGGRVTTPKVASAERQAVGERERGDGLEQLPGAAHDQQQAEHEQQMVDAEQDVLDAQREIAPGGVGERAGAGMQRRERHLDAGGAAGEEPPRASSRPASGR